MTLSMIRKTNKGQMVVDIGIGSLTVTSDAGNLQAQPSQKQQRVWHTVHDAAHPCPNGFQFMRINSIAHLIFAKWHENIR